MTNAKSTKKALLMSAVSLFLCFAMLLGTTYAWFTDSVTSANNIIKAGNLDIELEYWTEDGWKDVKDASDILTNSLWEPGVTEVAYLRVANAGSLALKYQLGINIVSEIAGKNVAGQEFLLSDYILFGVVENVNGETNAFATREAAVSAVAAAKKISAGYTKASSMTAGQELYFALVVYMPTTVDNVANHDGTNVPQIDLGINVIATQVANEEDSFDKYYDGATPWYGDVDTDWYTTADANATEYVIGTAEELAGLAQIVNDGTDSFAGKTIKLVSDIDLNDLAWAPIGNWDYSFEGNFDGNGHTISNLYINAPEGEGVGLFGVVANIAIENLTLNNVDVTAYSMVAGLVGAAYPAVISNCHVTGDINIFAEWAYVAGIAGYCYYGTQVDGCSTIADGMGAITSETRNAVGGITAWLLEGNHTVTNCDVANLNLTGWTNIGGITGFVHYSNTIEGCSVENVTLTKTRVDGNPGIGLIAGGYSYHATNATTLRNNTVDGATLNGTHVAYSSYNDLYGSEYGGATTANFVLENITSENITNNLVEVAPIASVADLKAAAANGGNYYLKNDLQVTETITSTAVTTIYMNGKTITGTFSGTGNKELFLVKGDLTFKNGSFDMTATVNQGWNAMATVFDVTAGGILNLDSVTAEVSGTDMSFIVHLNNWGEVTLNANNCEFYAPYVAVRVFNSGADMNNVTIENTNTYGGRFLWVHNYTSTDMGGKVYSGASAAYDEAVVAARLNFELNNNTSDHATPIRIGMNGATYYTLDGAIVVSSSEALQAAVNGGISNIVLAAGEYDVDLYVVSANRNLTITGQGAATKLNFKKGQVRLEQFDSLTISNCTIGRMVDKSWGQLVFASSTQAGGVYTLSNCTFDGVGTQGIYINQSVAATFNIENCTFNGDFGSEGAITVQNNDGDFTVNVTDCTFENIPETSHEIFVIYAYNGWTLNAEGVTAYWKALQ